MIKVRNLSKSFKVKVKGKGMFSRGTERKIVAVNNISFDVEQGERIAFIGPNGAGKSTTIKMLTGIIRADEGSGSISVMGFNPVTERMKLTKNIGCLFGQKSSLYMHLPAIDSYRLFGSIYDIDEKTLEERINELAKLFEIEDIINIPVRKLSLGQRMKAEILAAMLHKPKILFFDEPTIGLDITAKQNIREIIDRVNKENGTTIFLTSHDMADVERLCNRIIIVDRGEIVIDDTIESLKSKYMKSKVLKVTFADDVEKDKIVGIKVRSIIDNTIEIEFVKDKDNMGDIMNSLTTIGNVVDLKIDEIPLESIISEIYRKKGVHCNED